MGQVVETGIKINNSETFKSFLGLKKINKFEPALGLNNIKKVNVFYVLM